MKDSSKVHDLRCLIVLMIHLQVHLQIPCYDFLLFQMVGFTYFSELTPSPEGSPDHSLLQATGGVYKRQGHNQRKLMTCTY